MHPQLFLETFWQMEFRPQIFVAMSFDRKYDSRFKNVIVPAIESIQVGGVSLTAHRVDLSKSGDSILTEIIDGIAHSQMVLADVSSVRKGLIKPTAYRNGNVMYEVGLALACRQTSEVLLVRDDYDKFLFDVSTIPHMTIDFANTKIATDTLREALIARLNERNTINDARVNLALSSLTNEESKIIKMFADLPMGAGFGFSNTGFEAIAAIPRLLDKKIIKLIAEFEEGHPAYVFTTLGYRVASLIKSGLKKVKADLSPKADLDKSEQPI